MELVQTGKYFDDPFIKNPILIRGSFFSANFKVDGYPNLLSSLITIVFKRNLNQSTPDIELINGSGIEYCHGSTNDKLNIQVNIDTEKTLKLPRKDLTLHYGIYLQLTSQKTHCIGRGKVKVELSAILNEAVPISFSGSFDDSETWSGAIATLQSFSTSYQDTEHWSGSLAEVLPVSFSGSFNDLETFNGGSLLEGFTGSFQDSEQWTGSLVSSFSGTFQDAEQWSGTLVAESSYEPETTQWIANTEAIGGNPTLSQIQALDTLIKSWKSNGSWNRIHQFNPCFGDFFCAQTKVKYPSNISAYEILNNHNIATYSEVNGWLGFQSTIEGSVRYLKTGFDPFAQNCDPLDFGIWFDSGSGAGSGANSIWMMGLSEGEPDATDYTNTNLQQISTSLRGMINQPNVSNRWANANSSSAITGLFGALIRSDGQTRLFNNATILAFASGGANRQFRGGEIYVQSRNLMYQNTIQQSTNRNCRGYMITGGLLPVELAPFVDPWNTFKTSIGRN